MKVLVTGSNGFIGRRLCTRLREKGHLPFGFDCVEGETVFFQGRIEHTHDIADCVDLVQPDVIIHLAAQSHVPACTARPCDAVSANILGTLNILEAMRRISGATDRIKEVPRLVMASSAMETPQPGERINIYGATKAAATALAQGYAETYDLRVHAIRLANVFGPGQDERKFIPLAVRRLARGEQLDLNNGGQDWKEWIYVDAACNAFELAATTAYDVPFLVTSPIGIGARTSHIAFEIAAALDMLRPERAPHSGLIHVMLDGRRMPMSPPNYSAMNHPDNERRRDLVQQTVAAIYGQLSAEEKDSAL
jgi:dTDP-glucose 4,6-dehydratase